ncbi:MAG: hypothetical protein SPD98_02885 [Tractidigestivibacter sp.]|uniref:hypothetical protein n=1 Tax=Tractidigestivibacter sp. TaxID=2847320 RepID=UPI002A7F9FE7|nr:hypothetical protein [Tractidigestivibacter sp.]MCI6273922.1 hypothetical protein [Coriobacteriaceae bacterium]MDY4534181.1 hypothetical protein [Tractidigestivibacter sp.]
MREQKQVDKYELVTTVAVLCDELEATRRELRDMEDSVAACGDMGEGRPVSHADLLCMREGRKKVFEDSIYSWAGIKAERDEETGEIRVTPFERFRDDIYDSCPDSMSKREFYEYFDSEFRARYDEKKDKAVARLRESDDD